METSLFDREPCLPRFSSMQDFCLSLVSAVLMEIYEEWETGRGNLIFFTVP